jgi:tetratricopeptide (TPR) repeat protein
MAYLRAFLRMYQPFAERAAAAERVVSEASQALAQDPENNDALAAHGLLMSPFGGFVEAEPFLERLRKAPGSGEGRRYITWLLRHTGRVRESLDEAEQVYRLDRLEPMAANLVALARMAAGQVAAAVPVYEDLVARIPNMSFPISSLLRAHAFLHDWAAVDRLLAVAAARPLRELQDTIPFVRAKRDPTPENLAAYRSEFEAHVAITGGVDVSRMVYAAHLGLVDEAYRVAEGARLGPVGASTDIMGPDGYRTALLFQASMPELRNDRRFPRLCARLGLVEFWRTTGLWPDCADDLPYDFRAECAAVAQLPKDAFGF